MGKGKEQDFSTANGIIASLLANVRAVDPVEDAPIPDTDSQGEPEAVGSSCYDLDLAEFPLFYFGRQGKTHDPKVPLVYTDTIRGRDGELVTRTWKAFAGIHGFGGSTTQLLLYELLQMYREQGATGSQIQFGTLRSLFQRRGERHPSAKDYLRMRRDIDILRGYDFHCTNAFWDGKRKAYVDMNWRLFGSVFFFKATHDDEEREQPFGFIEVSSVLREAARTRGFFSLGLDRSYFYGLKPLEQRLAIYLAKKFVSQKKHQRFVDDLVKALPIDAEAERDARKILKRTALGLLEKGLPILSGFEYQKANDGRMLAVFTRKAIPKQDLSTIRLAANALTENEAFHLGRILEEVGGGEDRLWWTQCVRRLGGGSVDRALGLLKEAKRNGTVRNPGGLLTKFFKDIAAERGVVLTDANSYPRLKS